MAAKSACAHTGKRTAWAVGCVSPLRVHCMFRRRGTMRLRWVCIAPNLLHMCSGALGFPAHVQQMLALLCDQAASGLAKLQPSIWCTTPIDRVGSLGGREGNCDQATTTYTPNLWPSTISLEPTMSHTVHCQPSSEGSHVLFSSLLFCSRYSGRAGPS